MMHHPPTPHGQAVSQYPEILNDPRTDFSSPYPQCKPDTTGIDHRRRIDSKQRYDKSQFPGLHAESESHGHQTFASGGQVQTVSPVSTGSARSAGEEAAQAKSVPLTDVPLRHAAPPSPPASATSRAMTPTSSLAAQSYPSFSVDQQRSTSETQQQIPVQGPQPMPPPPPRYGAHYYAETGRSTYRPASQVSLHPPVMVSKYPVLHGRFPPHLAAPGEDGHLIDMIMERTDSVLAYCNMRREEGLTLVIFHQGAFRRAVMAVPDHVNTSGGVIDDLVGLALRTDWTRAPTARHAQLELFDKLGACLSIDAIMKGVRLPAMAETAYSAPSGHQYSPANYGSPYATPQAHPLMPPPPAPYLANMPYAQGHYSAGPNDWRAVQQQSVQATAAVQSSLAPPPESLIRKAPAGQSSRSEHNSEPTPAPAPSASSDKPAEAYEAGVERANESEANPVTSTTKTYKMYEHPHSVSQGAVSGTEREHPACMTQTTEHEKNYDKPMDTTAVDASQSSVPDNVTADAQIKAASGEQEPGASAEVADDDTIVADQASQTSTTFAKGNRTRILEHESDEALSTPPKSPVPPHTPQKIKLNLTKPKNSPEAKHNAKRQKVTKGWAYVDKHDEEIPEPEIDKEGSGRGRRAKKATSKFGD